MMVEKESLTLEEKVDILIKKVERIDRTVNPPFWKILLVWIWNHLLTIVILAILAYFVWEIWGVVQNIMQKANELNQQVDTFGNQITDMKEQIKSNLELLKFWQ